MQKAVQDSEKSFAGITKAGEKMSAVGTKLTKFVTLPIAGIGVASFKAASDLTESIGKTGVAFKDSARGVESWAKNLDSSFGLSERAALDAASGFGLLLTNLGQAPAQAAETSRILAERAADMGSLFNEPAEEISLAIRSALVGESEPIRRFGVLLSEDKVKAEAYAAGIAAVGTELTEAQKVQARLNIVLRESSVAHGDAARTADTSAGKLRKLKADTERLREELGKQLLPAFNKLAGVMLDKVLPALDKLSGDNGALLLMAAAMTGPVLRAIGAVTTALTFLAAHPLVLALTAFTMLTAGIIAAKNQWVTFPDPVIAAMNVVIAAVRSFVVPILGAFDAIISGAATAFGWIPGIGDKLQQANTAFDNFAASALNALSPIPDSAQRAAREIAEIAARTREAEAAMNRLHGAAARIPVGTSVNTSGGARPAFHQGGVVPGPRGADVPIIAQAGETIIPAGQRGGGGTNVTIIVNGVLTEGQAGQTLQEILLAHQRRSGALGFN